MRHKYCQHFFNDFNIHFRSNTRNPVRTIPLKFTVESMTTADHSMGDIAAQM